MKLVQKILSHGMLIAFFVAIFFLYLYRVELFPQWFGGEVESVAHKAAPELEIPPAAKSMPAVSASVTAPPPAPAVELPPMAEEVPASEPVAGKTPQPVTAAAPEAVVPAPARPTPEESAVPETAAAAQAAVTPALPPAAAPAPASAPAPVQQPPQELAQAQAAVSTTPPDYEEQLAGARELFWRRNMRGAVQAYRSLTESHPDRADAWGELGNLYFTMGRWSQAAEAYGQALGLLIDQGESARARNMLRVMHSLDSQKAGELEARLNQAGG